jgi:hypothetical protein
LEKTTELCRSGSKVEDKNLKKPAKQPSLNNTIIATPQARAPSFEPSCQKQKKEKEKKRKNINTSLYSLTRLVEQKLHRPNSREKFNFH